MSAIGLYLEEGRVAIAQTRSAFGNVPSARCEEFSISATLQAGADKDTSSSNSVASSSQLDRGIATDKWMNETLSRLSRSWSLSSKRVILSPPISGTVVRFFRMPMLSAAERSRAIHFEAKKYIPFRLEEVFCGYRTQTTVSSGKRWLDVTYYAVEREMCEQYITYCAQAGFRPAVLEPPHWALVRLIRRAVRIRPSEATVAVLVKEQGAHLMIFQGSLIYFATELFLPASPVASATGKLSAINIQAFVEPLLNELHIAIDYHRRQVGGMTVKRLVVVGEQGYQEGANALQKDLKIPVVVRDLVEEATGQKLSNAALVATGLSFRPPLTEPLPLVVAGKEKQGRIPEQARFLRMGMILLGLVAAFWAAMGGWLMIKVSAARRTYALQQSLQPAVPPVWQKLTTTELRTKIRQELDGQLQFVTRVTGDRVYQVKILEVLAKIDSPPIWLDQITTIDKIDPSSLSPMRSVVVRGRAFDRKQDAFDAVDQWVTQLKAQPVISQQFSEISLTSLKRDKEASTGLVMAYFEVECKPKPAATPAAGK